MKTAIVLHTAWALLALGIIGVCGMWLLLDWAALDRAWAAFQHAHAAHNESETAFCAAVQMSLRLNCAMEGLGVLFGTGLLAGVCWSVGMWRRR